MAEWFKATSSPVVVAANKRDKVKNSQLQANLEVIRESLALGDTEIIPFSAQTGEGRGRLASLLEQAARGYGGA
jgi:GTP-binding protein EngB required for normal cell division